MHPEICMATPAVTASPTSENRNMEIQNPPPMPPQPLAREFLKGRFRKRAVLANVASFRFLGSRIIQNHSFFCQGTFSEKKVLTGGSPRRELTKQQVLAAFSSCHVVGVIQEGASRIGRCRGTPIRSGVSSELATELLPASPGCLIKSQNR